MFGISGTVYEIGHDIAFVNTTDTYFIVGIVYIYTTVKSKRM